MTNNQDYHIDSEPDMCQHKSCGFCGSGLTRAILQESVEINGVMAGCCLDCYEDRVRFRCEGCYKIFAVLAKYADVNEPVSPRKGGLCDSCFDSKLKK